MTPSYKTSVASVKFLISQKPNIKTCFTPGSIGLTSSPYSMFLAIISDPASPNPRARRAPILLRVDSSIVVSIGSSLSSVFFIFLTSSSALLYDYSYALCSASSSNSNFSSSSWAAFNGSIVIACTLVIIFSIGVITKSVVSFEKSIAPAPRTKQTMNVVMIPKIA